MRTHLLIAVLIGCAVCGAAEGNASHDPDVRAALSHLAAADTAAAIDALRGADLEALDDPDWFTLLGRLYRQRDTIESRLRSQEVLERALQLFPDDPDVTLELGLTYFSQTFYRDAARYLRRALKMNPELCIAPYKLGVTHYERWKLRVNAFMDEAEKAASWLEKAIACDPENADAAIRYANVLYGSEQLAEADIAARRFAARFPHVVDFPLLAGTIARDNGHLMSADSAYQVAIDLMTQNERDAYLGLNRNVLGYSDLERFEKAPEAEKGVMERAYWIGADVDPTTDINERLIEHIYRTHRADIFFSHASFSVTWTRPQVRGWDTERGELSIKLGWPDDIYASHGGFRFEGWRYDIDGKKLWYPFADVYLNGKLQIPPSAARNGRLAAVRRLNRLTGVGSPAADVGGVIEAIAFKDDEMQCSIYVASHINADSMLRHIDPATLRQYHVRTRFFDENWVAEVTDSVALRAHEVPMLPGSRFAVYDVARGHPMPFGRYHIAFTFEDDGRRAAARLRTKCDASHLASSNLVSSEMMFLRDGIPGGAISRAGEILLPNPWRAYGYGQRLHLYFEVYNLSVVSGQSRYRVTYAIHDEPDENRSAWRLLGEYVGRFVGLAQGPPAVAQTIERVGVAHRSGERMAIDINMLPEGHYRLWLTIDDLNDGDHWETSRDFYKSGSDVARSD